MAKALPNLIVAGIMPALCFLAGRRLWGLTGADPFGVGWNGGCQVVRRLLGKPLSGLLIIGLLELVLRASVALALKSTQAFFIAPAIVTAFTGVIYIGSGFSSTPLVGKVLADLVPESALDVNDPRARGPPAQGIGALRCRAVAHRRGIAGHGREPFHHRLRGRALPGVLAATRAHGAAVAPFLLAGVRAMVRREGARLVAA